MVLGALRSGARKLAMRAALRGKATPLPDITTLRKIPEHLTYPLRRDGVDPVPALAQARSQEPVTVLGSVLGLDIFLVTGYEAAKTVLADSDSYSNDMRHLLGSKPRTDAEGIGGLGFTDPPEHTRLRGLLTPEFTMRRLKRLDEKIEGIVTEALDAMAAEIAAGADSVDLVQRFGFQIPFQVICEFLGMEKSVRDEFHELGMARFDLAEEGASGALGAATETRTFLFEVVKRKRAEVAAGGGDDGLICELLREHGDEFDDVELGGLADGAFLGGYETSAAMLSMGAYVLLQNRGAYDLLRTGSRTEVDGVVNELLRYLCPVQIAFPRFARADHELYGHQVKKGSVVVVSLSGANRDPEFVPNPEQFDLRNATTQHFAFGHGMHRCVGAELGRMELRAALTGLSARFPDLAMATTDPGELGWRDLSIVYSVSRLPVTLG